MTEFECPLHALSEKSEFLAQLWWIHTGLAVGATLAILFAAGIVFQYYRAVAHIDSELYRIWRWRAAARGMTVEQWLEDMTKSDKDS